MVSSASSSEHTLPATVLATSDDLSSTNSSNHRRLPGKNVVRLPRYGSDPWVLDNALGAGADLFVALSPC
jgi:hypothetical protein